MEENKNTAFDSSMDAMRDRLEEQRQQVNARLDGQETITDSEVKPERKIKFSLMKMMMVTSLGPLLFMGIVVTVYAVIMMLTSLQTEKLKSLTDTATSIRGAMTLANGGNLNMQDGVLCFGDTPIGNQPSYLDAFIDDSDTTISITYGTKTIITTAKDSSGNRLTGTELSAAAKEVVIDGAKFYSAKNEIINGDKCYVVYMPLRDSANKVMGVLVVSQPRSMVNKIVYAEVFKIAGISMAILIISVFIVAYSSYSVASATKKLEESISELAEGYLSITVGMKALRRDDEIGVMARSLQKTAKKMTDIIHEINATIRKLVKAGDKLEESAGASSETADEISRAVEGIARSAISQADDVETATASVETMGQGISAIVASLEELTRSSQQMMEADKKSVEIVEELFVSNEKTNSAINIVSERVNATDMSVSKIRDAVSVITSIAEETTLLSLNANIEAARAGEAGRGFQVVAIQIQKLAEESTKAAEKIEESISELSTDSQAAVEVMKEIGGIITEQQTKLEQTRKIFTDVSSGIGATIQGTEDIHSQSVNCDTARQGVVEVVNNLSEVSEANAASTEETTASMEELNASINMVADYASNLQKIAHNLQESVKFFKL